MPHNFISEPTQHCLIELDVCIVIMISPLILLAIYGEILANERVVDCGDNNVASRTNWKLTNMSSRHNAEAMTRLIYGDIRRDPNIASANGV